MCPPPNYQYTRLKQLSVKEAEALCQFPNTFDNSKGLCDCIEPTCPQGVQFVGISDTNYGSSYQDPMLMSTAQSYCYRGVFEAYSKNITSGAVIPRCTCTFPTYWAPVPAPCVMKTAKYSTIKTDERDPAKDRVKCQEACKADYKCQAFHSHIWFQIVYDCDLYADQCLKVPGYPENPICPGGKCVSSATPIYQRELTACPVQCGGAASVDYRFREGCVCKQPPSSAGGINNSTNEETQMCNLNGSSEFGAKTVADARRYCASWWEFQLKEKTGNVLECWCLRPNQILEPPLPPITVNPKVSPAAALLRTCTLYMTLSLSFFFSLIL